MCVCVGKILSVAAVQFYYFTFYYYFIVILVCTAKYREIFERVRERKALPGAWHCIFAVLTRREGGSCAEAKVLLLLKIAIKIYINKIS